MYFNIVQSLCECLQNWTLSACIKAVVCFRNEHLKDEKEELFIVYWYSVNKMQSCYP